MGTLIIQFIAGLVFLIGGAELLVRGSSRLASFVGIPPLIIGLTVVAFGTSSPELAVSLRSSLEGTPDIAMGNVIGSNIFNILLILGISALIRPLLVSGQLVRLDVPIMLGVSLLLLFFALNGSIGRVEGGILFIGALAYTIFLIKLAFNDRKGRDNEFSRQYFRNGKKLSQRLIIDIFFIIVGLLLLVFGSRFLISSSVVLAGLLGVGELVIGLTIIAAGTSLPEVATSITASLKGERDIAIGNAVGSNIFNILVVLGLTALVSPGGIPVSPAVLKFDMPVMIAVALACLPIFFTGGIISRWEGALFLAYYVSYTLYLILEASAHESIPFFGMIFQIFIIPLTVITLIVISWQAFRKKSGRS
ncbi:MAG: calcium/sodium antiporter [Calditrichaeota bacterium]|nr:calcium/sodium antiporter [Calditrichota bacterium]RQW02655.1 MAG: calcium/sodium antiporter [Calditrichota bacterium]